MTVEELIKDLSKYPKEMEVETEGCDCIGDTNKTMKYYSKDRWHEDTKTFTNDIVVLICRSECEYKEYKEYKEINV